MLATPRSQTMQREENRDGAMEARLVEMEVMIRKLTEET